MEVNDVGDVAEENGIEWNRIERNLIESEGGVNRKERERTYENML